MVAESAGTSLWARWTMGALPSESFSRGSPAQGPPATGSSGCAAGGRPAASSWAGGCAPSSAGCCVGAPPLSATPSEVDALLPRNLWLRARWRRLKGGSAVGSSPPSDASALFDDEMLSRDGRALTGAALLRRGLASCCSSSPSPENAGLLHTLGWAGGSGAIDAAADDCREAFDEAAGDTPSVGVTTGAVVASSLSMLSARPLSAAQLADRPGASNREAGSLGEMDEASSNEPASGAG
jgi:hypothetical protein